MSLSKGVADRVELDLRPISLSVSTNPLNRQGRVARRKPARGAADREIRTFGSRNGWPAAGLRLYNGLNFVLCFDGECALWRTRPSKFSRQALRSAPSHFCQLNLPQRAVTAEAILVAAVVVRTSAV